MKKLLTLLFTLCFFTPTWAGNLSYTAQDSVAYPIAGSLPNLDFSLKTRHNKIVTAKDFRGKVVIVFFGYAHCPDVCPLTLAQLARALKPLTPAQRNKVQILFISVDPERDTPDLVQDYVDLFKNGGIGLSGSRSEIQDIAKRYRVAYKITVPKKAPKGYYEVMHARGIYVFDEQGKAQYLISDGEDPKVITNTIKKLLN